MLESLIDSLKTFERDMKSLRRDVKSERVIQIAKKTLRQRAEMLGTTWFSKVVPGLQAANQLPADLLEGYSKLFARLIQLSSPNNLRSSYLDVLNDAAKSFRRDIIIPVQTSGGQPSAVSQVEKLLLGISSPTQSEYLAEAVACAKYRLFRGAAVLGWCAAIDQIHLAVHRVGFAQFNIASAPMASQTKGRFKKFNQVQNVSSLGELREVFDTTILWILGGMQLIDSNQHTRLRSCFELRCQCAHPGEAPVTEFNLLSFFSDLDLIVFKNPKLAP